MKKISLILCLILIFSTIGCEKQSADNKITVAVSIAPEEHFVRKICGDNVNVITMIPTGASAESYEMKFADIARFNDSDVYFSIGVPAEEKGILPNLSKETKHISLAEASNNSYPDIKIGDTRDPHIWLSPKRATAMVDKIAEQIAKLDPDNAEAYERNAAEYTKELENVYDEISKILENRKTDVFYISHPSYGYFADDFGLEMIALEQDGKEITPKELTALTNSAIKSGIKTVFCQEETSTSHAELLAKEIGGKVEILRPLSPDYETELKRTANLLSEAMK